MRSTNLRRIEKFEQALEPKGRTFWLWDNLDGKIDEKIAALEGEENLTPYEEVHEARWLRDDEVAQ